MSDSFQEIFPKVLLYITMGINAIFYIIFLIILIKKRHKPVVLAGFKYQIYPLAIIYSITNNSFEDDIDIICHLFGLFRNFCLILLISVQTCMAYFTLYSFIHCDDKAGQRRSIMPILIFFTYTPCLGFLVIHFCNEMQRSETTKLCKYMSKVPGFYRAGVYASYAVAYITIVCLLRRQLNRTLTPVGMTGYAQGYNKEIKKFLNGSYTFLALLATVSLLSISENTEEKSVMNTIIWIFRILSQCAFPLSACFLSCVSFDDMKNLFMCRNEDEDNSSNLDREEGSLGRTESIGMMLMG